MYRFKCENYKDRSNCLQLQYCMAMSEIHTKHVHVFQNLFDFEKLFIANLSKLKLFEFVSI